MKLTESDKEYPRQYHRVFPSREEAEEYLAECWGRNEIIMSWLDELRARGAHDVGIRFKSIQKNSRSSVSFKSAELKCWRQLDPGSISIAASSARSFAYPEFFVGNRLYSEANLEILQFRSVNHH